MTMCVAHVKSSGASPEAIQTQLNQLKYLDNPFINAAMTFTEPSGWIDYYSGLGIDSEEENETTGGRESGDSRGLIERTQGKATGANARVVFVASVQLNRYASGTKLGRKSWNWEISLLAWR